MSDRTSIEWTDASWNPIRARSLRTGKVGWHCEHKSEGCRNCYAEGFNLRLGTQQPYKPGHLGKDVEIFLDEKMLLAPLKWRKPRKIFVCSMTDLFADFVSDAMLDRIFAVMALCPSHVFQVLTKRPERMVEWFSRYDGAHDHNCADMVADEIAVQLGKPDAKGAARGGPESWPLSNVWLGVSVEDQESANERIQQLLDAPASVRWLSMEPLLGPVDLYRVDYREGVLDALDPEITPAIDWVVLGGESGRGARAMHPDWARHVRDHCAAWGVPFLFKQWGAWGPRDAALKHFGPDYDPANTVELAKLGKKKAGRLLDGVQHDGYPA